MDAGLSMMQGATGCRAGSGWHGETRDSALEREPERTIGFQSATLDGVGFQSTDPHRLVGESRLSTRKGLDSVKNKLQPLFSNRSARSERGIAEVHVSLDMKRMPPVITLPYERYRETSVASYQGRQRWRKPNRSLPGIRVASSATWNTGWCDQVDIHLNQIWYAYGGRPTRSGEAKDAAIRVAAQVGAITNIRVRNNYIYYPNIDAVAAIRMWGVSSYPVQTGEVTNNVFYDANSNDGARLGGYVGYLSVSGNSRNGSPASIVWVWPYW